MRVKNDAGLSADMARDLAKAFESSTGVGCRLLSASGSLDLNGPDQCAPLPCSFCRALAELNITSTSCLPLHLHSAKQAERFGGRYIYFCPHGLAHFASPIIVGGRAAAYLIGGPVLIMEAEDFLAGVPLQNEPSEEDIQFLLPSIGGFPKREPAALNHLSLLLFSVAAHLGDSSRELLFSAEAASQQRSIGDELLELNQADAAPSFPSDKEDALIQAVTDGDLITAKQMLNELWGYVFFRSGGDFDLIRSMAAELLFTISTAARSAGVDKDKLLNDNHYYFSRLERCLSFEDVISRIGEALNGYISQVSDQAPSKHRAIINRAVNYIKSNFSRRITLDDAASHVSLSSVYFSRIFKEAMGVTFNSYLNNLRIRHSAVLLSDSQLSVLEISSRSGFEDQSYYTKVFKKIMGVSPAKFREKQLSIDPCRERELDSDTFKSK